MTKFKVGDKVKCINSGGKGSGWREGREFIVDNLQDYPSNPCYWEKGSNEGVYESSLELAKSEPEEGEIELTLPLEIKELIVKNMALFIKRGYLTHKFKITIKGKNRLLTIIKELKK